MSHRKRVLFGALGALAPIMIGLVTIDFVAVAEGATLARWIGYGIRVSVLACLGGLVAYFHKTETSEFKAFQLGMAWPAFFTVGSFGVQSGAQYQELSRVRVEVDSAYSAQLIQAEQPDSLPAAWSSEHLDHLVNEMISPVPDTTLWGQLRRGLLVSRKQRPMQLVEPIR